MLSNNGTEALYQRLTRRDSGQVVRQSAATRGRTRDGRLKFGTVSTAVLAVLAEAGRPLRYVEIRAGVEARLGGSVDGSSVKQFLSAEVRHPKPRCLRLARGVYALPT